MQSEKISEQFGGNLASVIYKNLLDKIEEFDVFPPEEHYRIYAQVPASSIFCRDDVSHTLSGSGRKLSLVVCYDEAVRLVIEPESSGNCPWIRANVPGLNCVCMSELGLPQSGTDDAVRRVCDYLDALELSDESRSPDFKIRTIPLRELSCGKLDFMHSDFVGRDGTVTRKGQKSGVFYEIKSTGSSPNAETSAVIGETAGYHLLRRFLRKNCGKSGRIVSFGKRIQRLSLGLPSDDGYAKYLARTIRDVLKLPVASCFGEYPNSSAAVRLYLKETYNRAGRMQDAGEADSPVIGDALTAVRRLEAENREPSEYDICCELSLDMLLALCRPIAAEYDGQAAKQSGLSFPEPLCRLLEMPVIHYYYAVSLMQESAYPIWIYLNKIQQNPDLESPAVQSCTMHDLIKKGVDSFDYGGDTGSRAFSILYYLLAAPLGKI